MAALEKLQGFEGTEAAGVLGTGSEDETLKDRQVWKVEGGQDEKITAPCYYAQASHMQCF